MSKREKCTSEEWNHCRAEKMGCTGCYYNNTLEEAIKILNELKEKANIEDIDMNDCFNGEHIQAIETVLQSLQNSIPKKKIEEYLEEETEKYKVYKKEVDKNENLRPQLWNHLGRKNMCEKILGIEKTVTLD